jgi:Flp pilus assembly protein TadD
MPHGLRPHPVAWRLLPKRVMPVGSPGAAPALTQRSGHGPWLVGAGVLVALVIAVYLPVRRADFFYLDDAYYVTENPFVREGLTLAGLRRAFFGSHGALWMPLAFTSHMIDVSLFGAAPTGPHVVNVVLHLANSLLLFALLTRATAALAPSLVVAVLFAVHPLRVESVAWIAERKDVLSALMGLVTLHAWVGYTRAPSERGYRLVVCGTILALLSKPMLVTLPLLLLCFDVWPLRRVGALDPDGRGLGLRDLVIEKLPLLGLAALAAGITIFTATAQGAFVALEDRSVATRLVHALVAYVWYAGKSVWPTELGVFYPYPSWSGWQMAAALIALGGAAALAVAVRRRAPWITAGLAWFAIGLVPVSGLFQAGGQGMADRFTYLPAIGLTVAVVWTFDAAVRLRAARAACAVGAVAATVGLAALAHRQATYWQTSEAIFARTLAVTGDNWRVESALGNVLANAGRHSEALGHFARALRLRPDDAGAHYGLGLALGGLGRPEEAVGHYHEALRHDPGHWRAHNNLGVFLARTGQVDDALHHFTEAVRINPDAADATENLRGALALAGLPKENVDGYLSGLRTWSAAVANDHDEPGGAAYGARLAGEWLRARAVAVDACVKDPARARAPFSLYVQIDAGGVLTAVTAMPPTSAARCVRDELRTAQAPAPPFAPFHAKLSIPVEG